MTDFPSDSAPPPKFPSKTWTVAKQTPASDLLGAIDQALKAVDPDADLGRIAEELLVDVWTLYRWARGLTEPTAGNWLRLQRLARDLGIDPGPEAPQEGTP